MSEGKAGATLVTDEMIDVVVEAFNQCLCDACVQASVSRDDVAFALQEMTKARA